MVQKSSETPTESGARSFGEGEQLRRPGSNGGAQPNQGVSAGASWQENERRGSESQGRQSRYYQSAIDRLFQRARAYPETRGQGRFSGQSRWTEQGRPTGQGSFDDSNRWSEQGRFGEQDRWNQQGRFGEQDRRNEQDRWRERDQGRGFGEGPSFRGRQEGREDRGMFGEWGTRRQGGLWHREALMVRDIMTRNLKAVSPQSTLREAAQIMRDENIGIVPVVDQNRRLLGVLTDRDIVVRVVAEDRMPSQVRAQEVMTDDVEAVTEDEEVREVIELMGKKQIRRVPVVDPDDRLTGIVSLGDIANRADYDEELQEALQKISSKRSFWNRLFG